VFNNKLSKIQLDKVPVNYSSNTAASVTDRDRSTVSDNSATASATRCYYRLQVLLPAATRCYDRLKVLLPAAMGCYEGPQMQRQTTCAMMDYATSAMTDYRCYYQLLLRVPYDGEQVL
jgi:hypothetical protein